MDNGLLDDLGAYEVLIEVLNEDNYPVEASRLIQAAAWTVRAGRAAPAALTIVIEDDDSVRGYNEEFRGVDAPTDVLSFPADAPPVPMPEEADYLGDIIIAYPYALAQAEREQHAPGDSFALLVIHGTLHLLGYDHDGDESRARMWALQAEILTALGISPAIVPTLENSDH